MKKLYKLQLSIIFFVSTYYLLIYVQFYRYEPKISLFHTQKLNLSFNQLVLHSKCYCQKDIIKIQREPSHYKISIQNRNRTRYLSYEIEKSKFESLVVTCDLYNVLLRGPNQNVISYSLVKETRDIFFDNLKNTLKFVRENFKNWIVRVYHDSSLAKSTICEQQCLTDENQIPFKNIDFCNVNEIPYNLVNGWNAGYMVPLTWRWLPLGDHFVDTFLSRNTDSCLNTREVAAVNDWMTNSNSLFHFIRDHPSHEKEISSGLWGCLIKKDRKLAKSLLNPAMDNYLSKWYKESSGGDQSMLENYILPLTTNRSISHDSFFCMKYSNSVPFPTQRVSDCYVGSPNCCNRNSDIKNEMPKCPKVCRPYNHKKDWLYC